ncbi:hypothetical protein GH733_011199 [Mirounga leonina]|nr:hypothetical protein GH733_011199 [Mirounga leonina]
MKGKGAWPGRRGPQGTGGVTMRAERAAAVPTHLGGGRGLSSQGARAARFFDHSEYLADLRGRSPALALDPPALHTPPRRGPRTPGLRRADPRFNQPSSLVFLSRTQPGLSKSCRGAFQSPRPSPKSGQADGASKDSLHLDIQKLKEKRDLLDKEITQLISEGYNVDELEDHISQLHEYNDIKDVGQMLLGKLGEQQDPRGAAF